MNKVDIENLISSKIRKAAEEAIITAINNLNDAGHNFAPSDEFLHEWTEPDSDDSLKITCAIGVDISTKLKKISASDPVVKSFISLAESGEDMEATILNQLEGDIANGGFMQLYENKGKRFIKQSIALLQKIGSKSALRIIEQALLLFHEERDTIKKYGDFQKKLERLDNRFWDLQESIP